MNLQFAACLILAWISLFCLPSPGWAKTTPQTEIRVTLLGQSCLLQGPFDEATLKMIHSIGPAQIYPNIQSPDSPHALEQTRHALSQLRSSTSLPSLLDRYREKLGKRFDAQIAFLNGLEVVPKNAQYASLQKAGKLYLKKEDINSFESLLKKLLHSKKETQKSIGEQLFDLYNEGIEQDPEEEFHRAIKKLNVQYTCSFEESDE